VQMDVWPSALSLHLQRFIGFYGCWKKKENDEASSHAIRCWRKNCKHQVVFLLRCLFVQYYMLRFLQLSCLLSIQPQVSGEK
jgi:hypothetical protein